jgi:hypothetical protein
MTQDAWAIKVLDTCDRYWVHDKTWCDPGEVSVSVWGHSRGRGKTNQEARIRAAIAMTKEPFYREKIAEAGIDPEYGESFAGKAP